MRIISKHIEAPGQNELLQDISSLSDLIFLDIETTGLSSEHCSVYLIGCIYYQPDGWNHRSGGKRSSLLLPALCVRIQTHDPLQRRPL